MKPKPRVITLCGSTKFKQEFLEVMQALTFQDAIVLSVGFFGHADNIHLTDAQKKQVDQLHFRKIDLSDGILVIDVGGYIGESTRNEIEYAKKHGKTIEYYSRVFGGVS